MNKLNRKLQIKDFFVPSVEKMGFAVIIFVGYIMLRLVDLFFCIEILSLCIPTTEWSGECPPPTPPVAFCKVITPIVDNISWLLAIPLAYLVSNVVVWFLKSRTSKNAKSKS